MSSMADIIGATNLDPVPLEGDYYKTNKYGRTLYCGKCGTRKGFWMTFQGKYRQLPVMCQCRKVQVAADQEFAEQDALKRFRLKCLEDEALVSKRFESSVIFKEVKACREYANNFRQFAKDGIGLLLYGGVGAGKTHAAICIANQLIDAQIPVRVTSFPRMLQGKMDKEEFAQNLKRSSLVIIDDLGAERQTDYGLETVYYIVDELYKAKIPVIVTTNLDYGELKNPQAAEPKRTTYKRIYDRICERTIPIVFEGDSMRDKYAREKLSAAAALIRDKESEQCGL